MGLSVEDRLLLAAIGEGLPLVPRPYAAIGAGIGLTEPEVIERIERLIADGVVNRFGVVVRHAELGYRANAMVVWDVPDTDVDAVAQRLMDLPQVTLCYQRPRRLPDWPYNLFCMIHGRSRERVDRVIGTACRTAGIDHLPRAVLYSRRRFKQRGASYDVAAEGQQAAPS